jgi:hypothetical protein
MAQRPYKIIQQDFPQLRDFLAQCAAAPNIHATVALGSTIALAYLAVDAVKDFKDDRLLKIPEFPQSFRDFEMSYMLTDGGAAQFAVLRYARKNGKATRGIVLRITPLQLLFPAAGLKIGDDEIVNLMPALSPFVTVFSSSKIDTHKIFDDGLMLGMSESLNAKNERILQFDVNADFIMPCSVNARAIKLESPESPVKPGETKPDEDGGDADGRETTVKADEPKAPRPSLMKSNFSCTL